MNKKYKPDLFTGISYFYVHFAVEFICFFTIFRFFKLGDAWWFLALIYDILAFALQPVIGAIYENKPHKTPGPLGAILLMLGCVSVYITSTFFPDTFSLNILNNAVPLLFLPALILIGIGNGMIHISGALATLTVSKGRLSESAIFVSGGSFGLIFGRLLGSKSDSTIFLPLLILLLAFFVMLVNDYRIRKIHGHASFDFSKNPCKHNIAAEKSIISVILMLSVIIIVRAYIGYGLPTAWNQTTLQTIFLYLFMGTGKALGGILSDLFGARKVGILSCLLAVPVLILGDNIMWLSLIGVSLFSMTMAITLGGLVSVLPKNPGIAFGITTVCLLLGTAPIFFFPMPTQFICNILICVLSLFAAYGMWYTIKE